MASSRSRSTSVPTQPRLPSIHRAHRSRLSPRSFAGPATRRGSSAPSCSPRLNTAVSLPALACQGRQHALRCDAGLTTDADQVDRRSRHRGRGPADHRCPAIDVCPFRRPAACLGMHLFMGHGHGHGHGEGAGIRGSHTGGFGGATGIRTLDLLHAMQALSQLSYSPTRPRMLQQPGTCACPTFGCRSRALARARVERVDPAPDKSRGPVFLPGPSSPSSPRFVPAAFPFRGAFISMRLVDEQPSVDVALDLRGRRGRTEPAVAGGGRRGRSGGTLVAWR